MSWHLKFDLLDTKQVMYSPPDSAYSNSLPPCNQLFRMLLLFCSDSKLVSRWVEQTADEKMWIFHECDNQEVSKISSLKKLEDEVNLPEHPMITFGIV